MQNCFLICFNSGFVTNQIMSILTKWSLFANLVTYIIYITQQHCRLSCLASCMISMYIAIYTIINIIDRPFLVSIL